MTVAALTALAYPDRRARSSGTPETEQEVRATIENLEHLIATDVPFEELLHRAGFRGADQLEKFCSRHKRNDLARGVRHRRGRAVFEEAL